MRLPPLNALRAFEAASRHLSFQKAAKELHVTASALSYQIKSLEEHLDIQVFDRGIRKVTLTREGQLIQAGVSEAFDLLQTTINRLDDRKPDNIIVVSCGSSHAAKWLAPKLSSFATQHPDLELRISATTTLVDFARDDVDVAIRFGKGNYPGLHVERIFEEYLTPMVAPSLLQKGLPLQTPEDLNHFQLLHDDSFTQIDHSIGWIEWLTAANAQQVDGTRGLRFTHADHCIEAAIKGAGVALGRLELGIEDIKEGRIVTPFDLRIPTGYSTYFVCPPAHLKLDKNARFRSWLFTELLGAERAPT